MKTSLKTAFGLSAFLALAVGCGGGGTIQPAPAGQGQQQGGVSGGVAGQATATVVLRNVSREPIYYIYMSPASDNSWGRDLLGSDVLGIGQSFTISNIQPGMWDIRVQDQSGHWKEWRNERIDAGGQYTLDIDGENWNSQRH